jgi:septation ring formation regulator EzrA
MKTYMENVQNEYELTTDELGMVKPMIEAVENLQKETQAILRAITRLRRLEGNWNLVGDKLVKIETNGHLQ